MATKKQVIAFSKNAVKHIENNEIPFTEQDTDKDGISYKDGVFKYMGVAVCRILPDVNGNLSVIASSNIIFPDARKFLKDIQGLVKAPITRTYFIPQPPTAPHGFQDEEIKETIVNHLKSLSSSLTGTVSCKQFTRFYEQANALSLNIFNSWNLSKNTDFKNLATEYKKIYKRVGDDKEKVANFVDSHTLEENVAIAYFGEKCEELADVTDYVNLMKKYMNPTGELAYLKVIDGKVCTPEVGADGKYTEIMGRQDALDVALATIQGTVKRGQKYGKYTIMKNSDGIVKISCNSYTPEMIAIVYKELKQYSEE